MDIAKRLADEFSGPIIFGYVWWVLHEARARGIKRLYFLARDGYTLLRVARLFCERFSLPIECRYLYCSRMALRMPTYHFIGEEAYDLLLQWGYRVTLRSVLLRVDMDEEERRRVYAECGLSGEDEDRPLSKQEFADIAARIRRSRTFRAWVYDRSEAAYGPAVGYLRQEGLFGQDIVAVVDSGWTGSMQRSLRQLLEYAGYEGKLTGFYFGMFESPKCPADGEYLTWFFDAGGRAVDKARFCNNLFECLLAAPHGMTAGYREAHDRYEPILLPPPEDGETAMIQEQSDGIAFYAAQRVETVDFDPFDTAAARRDTAERIRRYMFRPTRAEAAYYGGLRFSDDVAESYRLSLAGGEQTQALRDYLFLRRAARRLRGKKPEGELFWPYGTIAFLPGQKQRWYRASVFAWEGLKHFLHRRTARKRPHYDLTDFQRLAARYAVVSFDIFDTLLYRTVNKPTDVFRLMERRAEQGFGVTDFYEKRVQAERAARERIQAEDVTLSDIYGAMHLDRPTAEALMAYEKQTELAVLRPDRVMSELLKWCVREGKKVLIISDMYHSEEFLSGALRRAGIENWDGLYLSSREGVTKAGGGLYRRVMEREGITDKKRWVHIGDNYSSDYVIPGSLGLHAFCYDNGRGSGISAFYRVKTMAHVAKGRISCLLHPKDRNCY